MTIYFCTFQMKSLHYLSYLSGNNCCKKSHFLMYIYKEIFTSKFRVYRLIFSFPIHWWILILIHLESATRGLAKVVSMYGMNISKNSFTIFSNGSAYVWFFLILGIYYTHALPIYERIFSFNCRFILNLLHSLTPYFLEDLRHVQYKCDQSQK